VLAGYASTPAEEMSVDVEKKDYTETKAYRTLMRVAERRNCLEEVEKILTETEDVDEEKLTEILTKISNKKEA
jgi:hypothetical protein